LSPTGLAVDHAGNVYVSSSGSQQKIVRFDPTGKHSTVFAPVQAAALAFDSSGNLYTTEAGGRLFRYDANGNKTSIGKSSDPNIAGYLPGVVVSADGSVFTTDANDMAVRKLAPTGNLLTPFAAGMANPTSIRVGPDGAVYIGNSSGDTVVKY